MIWQPARFALAMPGGDPLQVQGFTCRGLGLHQVIAPSPKGRRPGLWSLTHLNSGHRVAGVEGSDATVFKAALAVAELGDWDFDAVDGWRNMDPELPARLGQLAKSWLGVLRFGAGPQDRAQASAISTGRA